ncbi:Nucleotide-binding universal stress protein, UspA family [Sinosporangium album]|uniref:Nucleotide-binding universal stress protein, UspA family n=1 Tax=Sinosporangium album TaxID=504805 RepID=A0A1G8GGZ7_9ACTN|nr:universal stress protein [Sinosporangium album]SDH93663.1 Nucleotide-binding universal stress protein, UspA family [Sinosporangium album]
MIVAGVDGSAAGLEAATWAAREAALRKVPLRLVHVIPRWVRTMVEDAPYGEVGRWMREGAESVLRDAVEHVREDRPAVEVNAEAVPGDSRRVLIDMSRSTDLLVVGNHGIGGFRGLLLGSVALGVAGRTACPLAVVRAGGSTARGDVVVGVDGSEGSTAAAAFAFAEAALRGAGVRAIHVVARLPRAMEEVAGAHERVEPEARGGVDVPRGWRARREYAKQAACTAVAEQLESLRARYPSVPVTTRDAEGHPGEVLSEASVSAQLIVVGSRGRGGFTGLVLGSAGHALLHHGRCPTVIVPPPQE